MGKDIVFYCNSCVNKTLQARRGETIHYLQINNLEFMKIFQTALKSGESFRKLLVTYMYTKTFFGTAKIADNKPGWAGWRNTRLASKDLCMDRKVYVHLRNVLLQYRVLFRDKENAALFATDDDPLLWEAVRKRWPKQWKKKKDAQEANDSLENDLLENEAPYGNSEIEMPSEEALTDNSTIYTEDEQVSFSREEFAAIKNFSF